MEKLRRLGGTGRPLAQFTLSDDGQCQARLRKVKTMAKKEKYNGYCVKCKEKRDFEGEVKEMKNGRKMAQGTCPTCGTKINRILGKE